MDKEFSFDKFEPYAAEGRKFTESSLSRLDYHMKHGFIIVSTNKSNIDNALEKEYIDCCDYHNFDKEDDYSKSIFLKYRNLESDRELMSYLRSPKNKFSFTPINGGYRDVRGNTDSFEPSFIIYNSYKNNKGQDYEKSWRDLYNLALDICKEYYQDSVYIQEPDEAPRYVNSKGDTVSTRSSKHMKYNDMSQEYFSTINRYGASRGSKKPVRRFTADISFDESAPTIDRLIEKNRLYTRSTPSTYNAKVRRSGFGEIWEI